MIGWGATIVYYGASVVIIVIYFLVLQTLLRTSIKASEEKTGSWISVSSFATFVISCISTVFFINQLSDLNLVIARLSQFYGQTFAVTEAYSITFMCAILLTTTRAFFTISELDTGRYAGSELLVSVLRRTGYTKYFEAALRFFIIVVLSVFAGAFFRISYSGDGGMGTYAPLAEVDRLCRQVQAIDQKIGFGTDIRQCKRDEINSLQIGEGAAGHGKASVGDRVDFRAGDRIGAGYRGRERLTISRLTEQIMKPLDWLYWAFGFMLAWSTVAIVTIARLGSAEEKKRLLVPLVIQAFVPLLALASMFLMREWLHVAVTRKVGFVGQGEAVAAVETYLSIGASVGFIFAFILCFTIVWRVFHDLSPPKFSDIRKSFAHWGGK